MAGYLSIHPLLPVDMRIAVLWSKGGTISYKLTRTRVAWRNVAEGNWVRMATAQACMMVLAPPHEKSVFIKLP